jgi:hypothetical protein
VPQKGARAKFWRPALRTAAVEVLAPTHQLSGPRAIAKADVISQDHVDPKPVIAFLAEHMPTDRGSRADWGEIYGGFLAWQTERGGEALPASQFDAVLRHICDQAGIRVRRHGDRVYCLDRRVTWKT